MPRLTVGLNAFRVAARPLLHMDAKTGVISGLLHGSEATQFKLFDKVLKPTLLEVLDFLYSG